MTTLIIDRAGLEIRDDGSALAFYEGGERRGTVPLKLLERVIFQGGGLRIESGAMLKLADAGVSAMFMSPRVARRVAAVLGGHHNDAAVPLAQCSRHHSPDEEGITTSYRSMHHLRYSPWCNLSDQSCFLMASG